MVQIRITDISGGAYPINVFISDVYGNNQTLIATIESGPVPPVQVYNSTIPSIFETAPQIMLKLVDANGCETFKILNCDLGCAFEITIELSTCVINDISVELSSCEIDEISVELSSCVINISVEQPI
jgi:hypothetical protein